MVSRSDDRPAHRLDNFPPLDDLLERSLRRSFAARVFIGDVPLTDEPGRSLLFNLVRLAEKAAETYSETREHYAAFAEEFSATSMMRCIDDLENCINTTHRGYLFAEALRRLQPEHGRDPVVQDDTKLALRIVEGLVTRLRDIRHGIEHREEHLADTRPGGDGAFLAFQDVNFYLGDLYMSYVELAKLVTTLHDITCMIVPPT